MAISKYRRLAVGSGFQRCAQMRPAPHVHRHATRRLALALILGSLTLGPLLGPFATSAAHASYLPFSSAPSPWAQLLAHSKDLGPNTAKHVSVVVVLSGRSRPLSLDTWCQLHGLRASWFGGQSWASVSGPARELSRAIDVPIDNFIAPNGTRFYAALRDPSIPRVLRPVVHAIGRISSYLQLKVAGVPSGGFSPAGILHAYDATPLSRAGFLGQGETIVFFEIDGYTPADLANFAQRFHLPPYQLTVIGGQAGPSVGESTMDLETAHEVAPQAQLVYDNVAGVNTIAGWADAFAAIAHRFPGAIWSISLDACELGTNAADLSVVNSAVASAEAAGSTVFASSGDLGGADCLNFGAPSVVSGKGVTFPAVLPNITGVGGTNLSVTANGSYLRETAWSMSVMSQGSGGGVSTIVARPSWQTGPGVGAGGVAPGFREVPDISVVADPVSGTAFVSNGQQELGGGTSLGPPILSGFTALIDDYLRAHAHAPVGALNPSLYRLAASRSLHPRPLHYVAVGGNDFYSTRHGYSPVTGVGSPDVAVLAHDLLLIRG